MLPSRATSAVLALGIVIWRVTSPAGTMLARLVSVLTTVNPLAPTPRWLGSVVSDNDATACGVPNCRLAVEMARTEPCDGATRNAPPAPCTASSPVAASELASFVATTCPDEPVGEHELVVGW